MRAMLGPVRTCTSALQPLRARKKGQQEMLLEHHCEDEWVRIANGPKLYLSRFHGLNDGLCALGVAEDHELTVAHFRTAMRGLEPRKVLWQKGARFLGAILERQVRNGVHLYRLRHGVRYVRVDAACQESA